MLKPSILPEVGWLAPNGDYYPCDYDGVSRASMWHRRKAVEIIQQFYPEENTDQLEKDFEEQSFLVRKGWIRTDMNDIWWAHDYDDDAPEPTSDQIFTMHRLFEKNGLRRLPQEELRKFLVKYGVEYLR